MIKKFGPFIFAFVFVLGNITFFLLPYAMQEVPFSSQKTVEHLT